MFLLKETSVREYFTSLALILKGPQANSFEDNDLPVLRSTQVLPLVSAGPEPHPVFSEASYMRRSPFCLRGSFLFALFYILF